VIIGDRLRTLREGKKLSQGEIEKRTGLLRCYISRVENGYTVPAIQTLEKMARALGVPMYQLFYDGDIPPTLSDAPDRRMSSVGSGEKSGKDAHFLNNFSRLIGQVTEEDRKLLLLMTRKMALTKRRHQNLAQA